MFEDGFARRAAGAGDDRPSVATSRGLARGEGSRAGEGGARARGSSSRARRPRGRRRRDGGCFQKKRAEGVGTPPPPPPRGRDRRDRRDRRAPERERVLDVCPVQSDALPASQLHRRRSHRRAIFRAARRVRERVREDASRGFERDAALLDVDVARRRLGVQETDRAVQRDGLRGRGHRARGCGGGDAARPRARGALCAHPGAAGSWTRCWERRRWRASYFGSSVGETRFFKAQKHFL